MIQQNIDIVLNQGELYPNTLIAVYKGDSNILLSVKVENQFYADGQLVKKNMLEVGIFGRAIIRHKNNEEDPIYQTEVMDIVDGRLPVLIPNEAIDENKELGIYEIQIQVFNTLDEDFSRPRLTLPPFEIEVRDLISEDMVLEESTFNDIAVVGYGITDRAILLQEEGNPDEIIIDENENYVQTHWEDGDTIWSRQLNKIEKAISWICNKIKSLATKKELEDYATKESLNDYATKAESASKEDLEDYATNEELSETNDSIINLREVIVTFDNELSKSISTVNNKVNNNTTEIDNVKVLIEDVETQIEDLSLELVSDYISEDDLEAKNYVDDKELDKEVEDLKKYVSNNYPTTSTMNTYLKLKANKSDIPTRVSQLTNDAGYITMEDIGDINVDVDLTGYATKADINSLESQLSDKAEKEELEIMRLDIETMIGDIDRILDEINGEEI